MMMAICPIMKFDTSREGLHTLYKPYQAAILEHIWDLNIEDRTGMTSAQVHVFLQQTGVRELMRSRASVTFFLDDMVEEGVLGYEERSGKGGYHRVYYPAMDREQFADHIVETITNKLREVFPSKG